MTVKIFVGNLSGNTRAEDVRALFEKYGTVTECDVLKNYGFVHMQDSSEADSAIKELDGYSIKGSRMRVEMSTGAKSKRDGGGRGGKMMGRGRGRGGGGGDRYGQRSAYHDPYYRAPPPYDHYDRYYARERPPPRDDRRPPPVDDRYGRDRYDPYARRGPPPEHYDRYDRRSAPAADPYRRPPPDYYNRQRCDPYDYPEHSYPSDQGDAPPPPPSNYYNNGYNTDYQNGYERGTEENYYDRFYKKPPARPAPAMKPPAPKRDDDQGFMQREPIYF